MYVCRTLNFSGISVIHFFLKTLNMRRTQAFTLGFIEAKGPINIFLFFVGVRS